MIWESQPLIFIEMVPSISWILGCLGVFKQSNLVRDNEVGLYNDSIFICDNFVLRLIRDKLVCYDLILKSRFILSENEIFETDKDSFVSKKMQRSGFREQRFNFLPSNNCSQYLLSLVEYIVPCMLHLSLGVVICRLLSKQD